MMLTQSYCNRILAVVLVAICAFVGVQAVELGNSTVDLDGKNMRLQETNYGNFVADALRNATNADIALIHATAFKRDAFLPQGKIEDQAILDSLPGSYDAVVILPLTRDLLKNMLEVSLGSLPQTNSAFLQVSGLIVQFDSGQKFGARVQRIQAKGIDWTFPTTEADVRTIRVAVPMELGKGNAGYARLLPEAVVANMETTKFTVVQAISAEFARQKKEIAPAIEGRLTDAARR